MYVVNTMSSIYNWCDRWHVKCIMKKLIVSVQNFWYAPCIYIICMIHNTGGIVLTTINGIFKWYALHKIIVRGSLRVPFIIMSSIITYRIVKISWCSHFAFYLNLIFSVFFFPQYLLPYLSLLMSWWFLSLFELF